MNEIEKLLKEISSLKHQITDLISEHQITRRLVESQERTLYDYTLQLDNLVTDISSLLCGIGYTCEEYAKMLAEQYKKGILSNKIQAIKVIRAKFGLGLKESKQLFEKYEKDYQ